jgi:hypothetical protein
MEPCIRRLKARETRATPQVTRAPMKLERDCRDLTNRVTTFLTLAGNEADHTERQASTSMASWPWVSCAPPETGVFRTVQTRGRTLARGVSANRMALEGLAVDSPRSIPLPEAREGVHRGVLPPGVGPSVRRGTHGHHSRTCTVCDACMTWSASLPTSVKDVLTYVGASARLLGTLRRLLLLGREGRFLLRFLLPFKFFGHGVRS